MKRSSHLGRISPRWLGILLVSMIATSALGQAWPARPIRIIVSGPGGAGDLVSRQIAQATGAGFGQPVVVDNRGTDIIPGETVSRAPADGYTVLMDGNALWLAPYLHDKVPFDPLRDFAPITLAVTTPSVLIVPVSLPVSSVSDLIALAKSRPGALNYGTTGSGSSYHLAGELFKSMTGTDIVRVRYKGSAQAITDLISGRLQLIFATAPAAMPDVRAGKVKAIAVTSLQPSALAPGVPTMASAGLPGYESGSILGMFVPAKTPDAIVRRIHREMVQFLTSPDGKKRMFDVGVEPVASTPEEFTDKIKSEMAKWSKIIKDAGITSD